jgi:hypothetical protein
MVIVVQEHPSFIAEDEGGLVLGSRVGRCSPSLMAAGLIMSLAVTGRVASAAGPGDPLRQARPATVPSSDFNGDGFADLAVSSLYEDVNDVTDAGSVNVLYGSARGVQAGAPPNQFWTQASPGIEGSLEAGVQFGFCTTPGDFNGDGFSDLAICVPYMDVGAVTDAGGVEVLYGSAAGLQATGTGGPDDQLWTKDSPGVLGDPHSIDALSRSMTAGDFNADGYGDLAVEIRGEDVGPAMDAGGVEVLYGSATGLQADGVGGPDDQLWTQDAPGVEDQAESHDWFGRNLAAGDFNDDGFADLAAGDFLEDLEPIKDAGAVEILYGSATGLQADGTGAPDDQFWTQDSPGVGNSAEAGDYFGHSVTAADFDHDGHDDLAISSRLEDTGQKANTGAAEILYGSPHGLQATGVGGLDDQYWTQDVPGVLNDARSGDQFGFSFAAGDFNADSFDDVAIGVPFKNLPPSQDTGEVAVLYGSAAGLQAAGIGGPDDQEWTQDSPSVRGLAEPGDLFGVSLMAEDFDADGHADLAVGVEKQSYGDLSGAGGMAVLYGGAGGLQAVGPDDQIWNQNSSRVLDQLEAGDEFGWWLG